MHSMEKDKNKYSNSYLFQELVWHFLSLQFLKKFLSELLETRERPLGRQLGAADLLLVVAVQRDVEVEAGRWLSTCRFKIAKKILDLIKSS